jgi:hypothetical protein
MLPIWMSASCHRQSKAQRLLAKACRHLARFEQAKLAGETASDYANRLQHSALLNARVKASFSRLVMQFVQLEYAAPEPSQQHELEQAMLRTYRQLRWQLIGLWLQAYRYRQAG